MSTAHEEREAFALFDDAIDALFAIAHAPDGSPNAVPVDVRAVLIVGVPAGNTGDRTAHIGIYPRAGTQPADVRGLISAAGTLLDRIERPSRRRPRRLSRPRRGDPSGVAQAPLAATAILPLTPQNKNLIGARCPAVLMCRASGVAGWCRRIGIVRRLIAVGADGA